VPPLLQAKPLGHDPHVRPAQFTPGSAPHIRPSHPERHPRTSHRPSALQVLLAAQVPHCPPHPSEPHSRPAQTRVHTQRPLALHTDPAGHVSIPQKRPSQFAPGSGPHSRPLHAGVQTLSGGTHRPAALHPQPASGHVPHEPPAPLGPHSRPMHVGGVTTRAHEPAAQVSPAAQAPPQRPQFAVSVRVSTQPLSQTVWPDGQTHAPAAQLCPVGQRVPHSPQWFASLCGSTHIPAHTLRGALHPDVQTPSTHPLPAPQALPQAPQFSPSAMMFTQLPPQDARPEEHAGGASRGCPPSGSAHRSHAPTPLPSLRQVCTPGAPPGHTHDAIAPGVQEPSPTSAPPQAASTSTATIQFSHFMGMHLLSPHVRREAIYRTLRICYAIRGARKRSRMRRRKPARGPLYESQAYLTLLARIGANVRRLREAKNWSQEECAFQCGEMSAPLLRRIELAATNVTALTIARLCEGLGVDAVELLAAGTPHQKRRPGRPPKAAHADAGDLATAEPAVAISELADEARVGLNGVETANAAPQEEPTPGPPK
jgi:transcriptional regulator with XRE-family HTH domain